MKVLMIEPSGRRGMIQYTHGLSNALARLGHSIKLTTRVGFETRQLRREYDALELFNGYYPNPRTAGEFLSLLFRWRPEIIHIQGAIHPPAYFFLLKFLRIFHPRARFVYTAHEIIPKNAGSIDKIALRRLYPKADHIVVHSKQNRALLCKKFQIPLWKVSRVSVGNNMAIASELSWPRPLFNIPNKKKVLFFGIIEPHKGLMDLIEAFVEVKKNVPDAHLLIAGQPFENIEPYIVRIEELGLSDAVSKRFEYFPINSLPSIFSEADIVVLPYNKTYQSGVILSAYQFKKPVVATRVGGIPELVSDGKTGFLVAPGDIRSLADRITGLLRNDSARIAMGEAAHEYLGREHSWERVARKVDTVYRDCVLENVSRRQPVF